MCFAVVFLETLPMIREIACGIDTLISLQLSTSVEFDVPTFGGSLILLDVRMVPPNSRYFCAVNDYSGKADLSKGN